MYLFIYIYVGKENNCNKITTQQSMKIQFHIDSDQKVLIIK